MSSLRSFLAVIWDLPDLLLCMTMATLGMATMLIDRVIGHMAATSTAIGRREEINLGIAEVPGKAFRLYYATVINRTHARK